MPSLLIQLFQAKFKDSSIAAQTVDIKAIYERRETEAARTSAFSINLATQIITDPKMTKTLVIEKVLKDYLAENPVDRQFELNDFWTSVSIGSKLGSISKKADEISEFINQEEDPFSDESLSEALGDYQKTLKTKGGRELSSDIQITAIGEITLGGEKTPEQKAEEQKKLDRKASLEKLEKTELVARCLTAYDLFFDTKMPGKLQSSSLSEAVESIFDKKYKDPDSVTFQEKIECGQQILAFTTKSEDLIGDYLLNEQNQKLKAIKEKVAAPEATEVPTTTASTALPEPSAPLITPPDTVHEATTSEIPLSADMTLSEGIPERCTEETAFEPSVEEDPEESEHTKTELFPFDVEYNISETKYGDIIISENVEGKSMLKIQDGGDTESVKIQEDYYFSGEFLVFHEVGKIQTRILDITTKKQYFLPTSGYLNKIEKDKKGKVLVTYENKQISYNLDNASEIESKSGIYYNDKFYPTPEGAEIVPINAICYKIGNELEQEITIFCKNKNTLANTLPIKEYVMPDSTPAKLQGNGGGWSDKIQRSFFGVLGRILPASRILYEDLSTIHLPLEQSQKYAPKPYTSKIYTDPYFIQQAYNDNIRFSEDQDSESYNNIFNIIKNNSFTVLESNIIRSLNITKTDQKEKVKGILVDGIKDYSKIETGLKDKLIDAIDKEDFYNIKVVFDNLKEDSIQK